MNQASDLGGSPQMEHTVVYTQHFEASVFRVHVDPEKKEGD